MVQDYWYCTYTLVLGSTSNVCACVCACVHVRVCMYMHEWCMCCISDIQHTIMPLFQLSWVLKLGYVGDHRYLSADVVTRSSRTIAVQASLCHVRLCVLYVYSSWNFYIWSDHNTVTDE